jgi:mono/diheme cytochrome c family protein
MKRLLAVMLAVILSGTAYGQFGEVPVNQNSVNSTGLVLNQTNGKAYTSPTWQYERYEYWQCGRKYYGYRPVLSQPQAAASNVKQEFNPIGSINTDNSTTHSYTYNITYGQLPVQQGSTLYGYSYASVADVYGNTDIGALYNQAIRLAGDANAYADRANTNAMSMVAQAGRERAKVAEILAKGQVIAQANASAAALAHAVSPGQEVNVQSSSNTVVNGSTSVTKGNGQTVVERDQAPVPQGAVQKIFNDSCVKCHRTGKEAGGLNLEDASKLTADEVQSVLARITTGDPAKRMPKSDGTGPAESLSVEAIGTLFRAASN